MRDLYPRLFEPPFLEPGVSNPRDLEDSEYRARVLDLEAAHAEKANLRSLTLRACRRGLTEAEQRQ